MICSKLSKYIPWFLVHANSYIVLNIVVLGCISYRNYAIIKLVFKACDHAATKTSLNLDNLINLMQQVYIIVS